MAVPIAYNVRSVVKRWTSAVVAVLGVAGVLHAHRHCTFRIDIPDAQPGAWRYTVTPLEVPFANYPFTLTIGEKR